MAANDFRVAFSNAVSIANPYSIKANTTGPLVGELVIVDSNAGYVALPANGASNSSVWVGLVVSVETAVTASADGKVMVVDDPTTMFVGKATTPANLAIALKNTQVTLDLAGGVYTIDENDSVNGTFIIKDFDNTTDGNVYFQFASNDHVSAG